MANIMKQGSIYFGSEALGRLWVPTIMKARHSFLSCMCLGASHHDIMNGLKGEGPTTVALKVAVIRQIREDVVAPWDEVKEGTIIAILHLLGAEVVNGDEVSLKAHLHGLGIILKQCGGLSTLGLDGLIANILSMYVPTSRQAPMQVQSTCCSPSPI
jgi:hypothetical protein